MLFCLPNRHLQARTSIVLAQKYRNRIARNALSIIYLQYAERICATIFSSKQSFLIPVTSGTFQLVYLVRQNRTAPTLIVRIFPNEFSDSSYYECLIDVWINSIAQKHGFPVPTLFTYDFSQKYIPCSYQIFEHAPGKSATLFMDDKTQHMNRTLLMSIGATMRDIHSVILNGYGPLVFQHGCDEPIGVNNLWLESIYSSFENDLNVCVEYNLISNVESKEILFFFKIYEKHMNIERGRLLHGDLGNHNLFIDFNKVSSVIDWEDGLSGDPVYEIAYWGTFFRDHMLDHLLVGYTQSAELVSDFLVRYWLYYLRISVAKTVHRIFFEYQDHPQRQPPSLRIQKALSKLREL